VRTERGAIGYYPSEVGQHKPESTEEDTGRTLEPEAERVITGIQAPESEEVDTDDEELNEGKVEDDVFIDKMEKLKFFALDDYLKSLKKEITVVEKQQMINDEAIRLRVNATEAVSIESNLKIIGKDGTVVQITTTDGQILAVHKIDTSKDNIDDEGKFKNKNGKLNLFINPESPNDNPSDTDNNKIQYSYQDADRNKKSGYSIKYATSQSAGKFAKIKKLAKKIPSIKKACKEDFNNPSSGKRGNMRPKSVKEASLALALVLNTARRIGGVQGLSWVTADGKEGRPEKLDKEKKPIRVQVPTYGVTTLQARHINVSKGGKVSLEFIGKSGKTNYVNVTDEMVKKELIDRRKAAGKKVDTKIINTSAATVNNYFKSVAGSEFSAKNFRTYQGTMSAAATLDSIKEIPSHFGKYPMIRYGKKTVKGKVIPVEIKSTWGAEFDKYMNTQINNGGIDDKDTYRRVGILWLLKSQYISKRDFVGRPVSEKLSNEPHVALDKYINPEVFDHAGWSDAFQLEQEEFLNSNAPRNLGARIKVAQGKLDKKAKRAEEKAKGNN